MQAIKPDLKLPAPVDSAQSSLNFKQPSAQGTDFKKTLQYTDEKAVRKPASHKSDSAKSGKHQPDPGNDPPATPVPVTVSAALNANLPAPAASIAGALNPLVDDSVPANTSVVGVAVAGASPVAVAAAAPGAKSVAVGDADQSSATASVTTPLAANVNGQASNTSLLDSGNEGATSDKGASSAVSVAPPTAQAEVKSQVPNVAAANIKENTTAGGNTATGTTTPAAGAVGSSAATADSSSSLAAPNADADVTSQTTLAATMAAAATSVIAPAVSTTSVNTSAPATSAAPGTAADLAASLAFDPAQPASAAVAASVAQVVIGAAQLSALDKHSHVPTTDKASVLEGNQGAVGFAQLVSTSSSADAAPPNLKVAAAVDTPQFAQGVGNQVQVMVDNGLNTAKLQVNPASLGPIEVRIAIQNGHAQVWMTSHSAVTRDALESSTPQLKDMLGSQGFSQVSVDISQRSFQERTPQPHSYDWQPLSGEDSAVPIQSGSVSTARGGSSVVDAYA